MSAVAGRVIGVSEPTVALETSDRTEEGAPARWVVAVDGPSGSGKSSASRGVAERLGLAYLDTGAMYRAMTWLVLEQGVDAAETERVAELVETADLQISLDPAAPTFAINGTDVTVDIREPRISAAVSGVATNLRARANMVARQQQIIAEAQQGIVAEGRDITTVVAPEAHVRVLLVADPQARIARRQAELGEKVDTAAVTDQIIRRDRDDSTVAEFSDAAEGVAVIDSTFLDLPGVIDAIIALVPASQE